MVGKRAKETTYTFPTDLQKRLADARFRLTTDGFHSYQRAVEDVFGGTVDFAQLTKFFSEDYLPMTMQVGMAASNGVILASDTKCWDESLGRTVTFGLAKIRVSDDRKMAVSCAHDMKLAFRAADSITANLLPKLWRKPEAHISEIVLSELDRTGAQQHECLIVLSEPTPTLYVFSSGQKINAEWVDQMCSRVPTYAFCGHLTNAAVFWADRFFRPDVPRLRTMEELIPLASQIIVDAGRLSSGNIGGLEIIECGASGIRVLTPEENIALEAAAYKRGVKIEQTLFLG